MITPSQRRLQELESRFIELEDKLSNTPEKEAISILHAMFQESLRTKQFSLSSNSGTQASSITLEDIANLYKLAPAMDGEAKNKGLPVGTKAPDFNLPDVNGNFVRLSDFHGKIVILVFYPLDFSLACSDQLSLYQAVYHRCQWFHPICPCLSPTESYPGHLRAIQSVGTS